MKFYYLDMPKALASLDSTSQAFWTTPFCMAIINHKIHEAFKEYFKSDEYSKKKFLRNDALHWLNSNNFIITQVEQSDIFIDRQTEIPAYHICAYLAKDGKATTDYVKIVLEDKKNMVNKIASYITTLISEKLSGPSTNVPIDLFNKQDLFATPEILHNLKLCMDYINVISLEPITPRIAGEFTRFFTKASNQLFAEKTVAHPATPRYSAG